jgi:hypothetical protein
MANTWGAQTWSFNQWNDLSNVSYTLTGQALSFSLGNTTASGEVNQGWGSDTWGTETWGISGLDIQLTGIGLSVSLSSVTTQSDVDDFTVTGQQATVVASSTFNAEVTGIPLTATLQYQEAVVDVTGIAMSMQEGDETPEANTIAQVSATSVATWNGNFAWGYGVWGNQPITTLAMSMQEGTTDPAPDVSLTGNAAAMFLGEETITGDANLDLTGISLTFTLGTAVGDANTIASPSGILLSMQEGDEGTTANARVNLTGNALTTATGTVYNLIWNQVNTGTTSAWTEVDTAA